MKKSPFNLVSVIWASLSLAGFTAVGEPSVVDYCAVATHPCSITDYSGTYSFGTRGDDTEGFYCEAWQLQGYYGLSSLMVSDSGDNNEVTANVPDGLRFKGWWTKKDGWSDDVTPRVSQVDTLIESKATIKLPWLSGTRGVSSPK